MKLTFKPKHLSSFLFLPPFNFIPKNSPKYFYVTSANDSKTDYEHTLVAELKSCASLSSAPLLHGQRLHAHILKHGYDSNIFIRNSLISLYAKFGAAINDAESIFLSVSQLDRVSCNIMLAGYVRVGRLIDARQLFDKMPGRNNGISFTTMIMGLAQNGFWYEAIRVFEEMRSLGLAPNEVTMSSVLSSYSRVSAGVGNGRMLHGFVVKSGFEDFNFVVTNLVHLYCACSCLGDARVLFDGMSERNVVSWNVMLNGYSKARLARLARRPMLFLGERSLNVFLHVEDLREALTLYHAMVSGGIRPNDVMVVDIISGCSQVMAFSEGQQFHALTVKSGFDRYDFIQSTIIHFYAACHHIDLAQTQFELGSKDHLSSWNALISGLVRNGMMESARELFEKMPARDVFSWSSMISGYSQTENPDMAIQLFHEMVASGVKPNEVTMVSMVSAIATLGILQEGRWAHEYIINNLIPVNDNLSAAIIDMYAKCGSIKNALQVFNEVRDNVSSISPWNAIVCGLAMNGHARSALAIFSDLEKSGIRANSITFIGVLSACCHAGLVEEGKRHFESMKSVYGIEPNVKHYGCMVDLLGKAGRLEEAEDVIKSMPMEADVVIWGTLLAASRNYGDVEMGERAAASLAKAEPSHGPARILLCNLYVDAGRLEDAAFVRREMKNQRLTRSPGYSGVI
ncbi:hypothetical protein OSB04_030020 [Centaurea solstitialis]|uniref:Uncharacterized protein n=1 Tax=Centaurea solstitialis TaxID=347529 RepID=A0AA38VWA7_9ASTR|nr:hypothetical protein OSB04_030020 [Centaurea solstitialis]